MKLPTLYKLDSKGKVRSWSVEVRDKLFPPQIVVSHGEHNGKQQIKITKINEGKNIGRANETVPVEQALNEAQSKWNKQIDKGYTQTIPSSKKFTPMLAHRFDQHPHKVKYPAFLQVKLDGARFTMTCEGNEIIGKSRGGKPFCVPHIVDSFSYILKANSNIIFDGELFTRDISFQEILSAIKRDEPNDLTGKVEYWIYDLYHKEYPDLPFQQRFGLLKGLPKLDFIKIVNTYTVNSEQEIIKWHNHNVNEGFEGSIIRNANGVYKLGRSHDLLKVKDFQDEEFKIVGKTLDKNKECVFTCITKENKQFSVKPEGSHEERQQYFVDDNIGQMLNVRFFEWTDDNIPRFPVGVYIRSN